LDLSQYNHDIVFDKKLHSGSTGLNLFVGLQGTADELNIPSCHYWIHPDQDLDWTADVGRSLTLNEALELEPEEWPGPLFVGFPCRKDQAWSENHPNQVTVEVLTWSPWHWWEEFENAFDKKSQSHGVKYEQAKETISKKIWARVAEVVNQSGAKLPRTLEKADYHDMGTPLSYAHFLNADGGSFYALDHDRQRFLPKNYYLRLRPEIPEVPGLYLTGSDAMTLGFVGAMSGGLICAQQVLGIHDPMMLLRKTVEYKISDDERSAPDAVYTAV